MKGLTFAQVSSSALLVIIALVPSLALADTPPLTDGIEIVIYQEGVENAYPHWSKDGKTILYQSNRTGKWQLYVIGRDGKNDRRITNDSFNNYMADWSPDNRQIAFVSDRSGNEEIFVMNADGGGQRNLSNNPARDIHPYWTPDGQSLYFNSTRDDQDHLAIYQMTVARSRVKKISTSGDDETCAHLSLDGSKLVYLRGYMSMNDEIFSLDLKTGKAENVSKTPGAEGWPCWTPDGNRIIYSSDQNGSFNLFASVPGEKSPTRLTHVSAPWYDARAMVSPDGKEIVFNRQKQGSIGIAIMKL